MGGFYLLVFFNSSYQSMFKKILLAVSSTGKAEEMLQMLLKTEALTTTQVTILTVTPQPTGSDQTDSQHQEAVQRLEAAQRSLPLPAGQVSTLLRPGDPKTVVCEVAEEIDADLIIMGSRGLKRLQSILQNSVSQYVFQLSSRSMLLVKDDIFITRINRIMVAFNADNPSDQSLALALELLREIPGGELLLAHTGSTAGRTAADQDPALAGAIAQAKRLGVNYRCFTQQGDASRELCKLAESAQANLLILDSPERRPSIAKSLPDLDRLLGASVSDYVRVNAACPVLLARKAA